MQLSSQQTLPVSQAQAWQALNDAELLQRSIPGCESLEPDGEHAWTVEIRAAVGPVKARFKGRLRLEDLQPPERYTMHFEGKGGPAGHGKGHAEVRLEALGAQQTALHYQAQASVGGKLAQVGSRIVDMAAQKMAAQFFEAFDAALRQRYAVADEAPVPEAAPPGWWQRLRAWLARLFGGSA